MRVKRTGQAKEPGSRRLISHLPPVSSSAFAFPDLLVVLAALMLITAVGLPMLLKSRSASHRATCISNLKQVNRALLQYAEENAGTLPSGNATTKQAGIWWWYRENVKSYLGIKAPPSPADKVFACPDDRGYDEPGPFWRNPRFAFTSYNFNGVTVPGVPGIAGWAVSAIKEPSRTLLSMEWTAHAPLSWHDSKTGSKNAPFYNDALSVVGFVDGHVDYIKIHYDGINPAYTRDPVPGYSYRYSGGD